MMQEKRAEAKKTAATIYATPGTNATKTEASRFHRVVSCPNYSSSREEGGFAKSLYEVPENLLKPTERKVDEQAEMEKWTSEGKNPALKLQARPAADDTTSTFCRPQWKLATSAKPAGQSCLRNRQSRRQSPQNRNLPDIGPVPETDGPFRGETSLQRTHQRAPHHRPAL